MQVILLEKVEKLGQMGDVVTVKPGYARNFLLPQEKALRATKTNIAYFEAEKKALEANNEKAKAEAEKLAKKIDGMVVPMIRQASEAGSLFGSVSSRDIAIAITETGEKVDRNQVVINRAYKTLGLFPITLKLHPEVSAEITLNVARSADEAKIQEERGEALIVTAEDEKAQIAAEKKAEREAKLKKAEARKAKSAKKSDEDKAAEEADAKAEEVIAAAGVEPETVENA